MALLVRWKLFRPHEAPPRAWADDDPHGGRDDGGAAARSGGSLTHPIAWPWDLLGQQSEATPARPLAAEHENIQGELRE
jgi:hypothetical protein